MLEKLLEYLKSQNLTISEDRHNKLIDYVYHKAKELNTKNESCLAVSDEQVYEWCRHFALETQESIDKEIGTQQHTETKVEAPTVKPAAPIKQPKKKDWEQMNLFSLSEEE